MYSFLGFHPFRRIESYPLTDHRASFVGYFGQLPGTKHGSSV